MNTCCQTRTVNGERKRGAGSEPQHTPNSPRSRAGSVPVPLFRVLLWAAWAASCYTTAWAQQPEAAPATPAAPTAEEWIQQLQAPSAEARYAALGGLRDIGRAAAARMIEVLADASRANEHPNIRAALARMGPQATGPLLGTLQNGPPELTVQTIRILAAMDAKAAAIHLLRPYFLETDDLKVRGAAGAAIGRLTGQVPTRREAVAALIDQATEYFDRQQPLEGAVAGRVELWSWDAETNRCTPTSYSAEDATVAMAARLARDAHLLLPEDPRVRRIYLGTMLQAAANKAGWDKSLPSGAATAADEAARFGARAVEDVLHYAMVNDHVAAATAAAEILGRIGTAEELLYQGPATSPLVLATRHPDRRLRLAATDAVIRLQPLLPFAGSSQIVQSLGFFAASSGARRALVAGPSTQNSRVSGPLAAMGFEVDTATNGRELFELAAGSPDYELALIDVTIERPSADLLVQQLHRDWRTATLRVGLIARNDLLERARRITRDDPMTLTFSPPHTAQAVTWQAEQLATLAPRAFVDFAERQRQAAAALSRLAELGDSLHKLYDLRQIESSVLAGLYAPKLGAKAAAVLGTLGTPRSQQVLADQAGRDIQSWDVRRAAVTAFRRSIQRHGILLTSDQLRRQYDRYNQSENRDPATRQLLGLILDCIEAPTRAVTQTTSNGDHGE